ncbi:MAG TPA: hypothetical protein VEX18_21705, partial [Polyangiaceae bacterium]|nr:hypothetical protein [Polyangiaceae bacterium]
MGFDFLLAAALSLIAGGVLPLAPAGTLAGFVAALGLTWRAFGVRQCCWCLALFGLGALRGWWSL